MKILSWLLVLAGIGGLIGVRMFEDRLFYDPFLQYFREANKNAAVPSFEWGRLILGHLFRFFLNLMFSLVIVQFIFKNKKWTAKAAVLIVLVFIITFPIYLYCISTGFSIGYLFSFYIRRFVIQPLVLLLLIPMFYYRRKMESSAETA